MGRLMSPSEYGVLMALFSLLYLISVPGQVLVTTATKFASKFKVEDNYAGVTAVLSWISQLVLVFGGIVLIGAFFFRQSLADFLQVGQVALPVWFFGYIAISLLNSAPTGFLQGLLRFRAYSILSILGPLLKALFSVGFIQLGLGVLGTTLGLLTSSLATLMIALWLLRKNLVFPFEKNSFSKKNLVAYVLPTIFITLALNSFHNTDILVVKNFFKADAAGLYSSVVILGRVIFFGLSSVGLVMFPVISEKFEKKQDYLPILKRGLGLVGGGAVAAAIIYGFLPQLIVGKLFGASYLGAVPFLGYEAVFMGLYSLVYLLVQFFLSIRRLSVAIPLCLSALTHAILLRFFHDSLFTVLRVNIGVMLGTVVLIGIYSVAEKK